MGGESELELLCDTLRRCGIQVSSTPLVKLAQRHWSMSPYSLIYPKEQFIRQVEQELAGLRENTVYQLTDPFSCRYVYFLLPGLEAALTVGPFLSGRIRKERLMEAAESLNATAQQVRQLEKFYAGVPVLETGDHIFILLSAFYDRLWGEKGYSVEQVDRERTPGNLSVGARVEPEETPQWNMEMMELRYARENELMEAVSAGQLHKIELLLAQFSIEDFEKRASDGLRNLKNYCIITNTLFRKAAEKGGVHPYYLDSVSSDFARRIETVTGEKQIPELMGNMARAYCGLVRKYAGQEYSAPVRRAIIHIDSDLSGDLGLQKLAQKLNINASYLSALFKKETGMTVTRFVLQRRMALAKQLLTDTRLQVQTVAQYCGIVDVHYFSKLFKRFTGRTPREFRKG